jgi:hypothetical protein
MMETAAQSFTARRPAANQLPTFQLPPPDHLPIHKYQPAYAPSTTQPSPAASNVLTPPVGLPSDGLSPLASSVNSGSSGSSAGGVPPYQQSMGYWPTPGSNSSYTYSAAPPMPTTFATGQPNYNMGRPMYSPMSFPNRNTNSPTAGEGLPPPPYEISLPSFSNGMSAGQQQSLPTLAPQQQSQAQQQQNQQHQHQQHLGSNNMSQPPATQAPQQSPMHAPDSYGRQPPPAPANYYTPASTPQQPTFPAYAQQSPTQQSPNTSSAPQNRISPVSAHPHSSLAAPQGYHPQSYGRYNLPAMTGPIMSNAHQPGGPMALVGGMQMQYPQHQMGGPMYGHHPGQQQPQNDRPFKCDQCPQSFNRNHDLKRHKRIHLAVKPFPCTHCEKSFSRKDALKVSPRYRTSSTCNQKLTH